MEPFTLDGLLKLHPHEVVELLNRYQDALKVIAQFPDRNSEWLARTAIAALNPASKETAVIYWHLLTLAFIAITCAPFIIPSRRKPMPWDFR